MGVRLQFTFTPGNGRRAALVSRRRVTYARAVRRLQLPASGGQPGKSAT